MSNQREEFPELADESKAALEAAHKTHIVNVVYDNVHARRYCAALLREAMKQAGPPEMSVLSKWVNLAAIHRNLHSPTPPPPTLAQAREADLDTPEGKATVSAFLATVGEGVQS